MHIPPAAPSRASPLGTSSLPDPEFAASQAPTVDPCILCSLR